MVETLSTKTIYKGNIFDVRVDDLRQNEVEYARDVIVHKGSAVIVPVSDDNMVALVRQYRHAAGKYLLEVPAGSLDDDETPIEAAHRELEEEIGVTAKKMEKFAEFYISPGFLTEKMYLFLATGLSKTAQRLETDEILEIELYSFVQAFNLIRTGAIEDAKTIIGLTFAGPRFGVTF